MCLACTREGEGGGYETGARSSSTSKRFALINIDRLKVTATSVKHFSHER